MQKIRIAGLGGLDENGKNMYIIEIDGDIFLIEAGLKYSESFQLGVEYIIPDFSYLKEHKDNIKGLFITHAHDDVMMALPHLLDVIDVPIYTTALTAKIIKNVLKIDKHINIMTRNDCVDVDGHKVYSFPVMQSIADGIGLVFDTDQGLIIYSGEFMVDYDFSNPNFSMDLNVLTKLASEKKVLCLLSESSSAKKQGYTSPKHRITDHVEQYFENAEHRIIVSIYKQNLFRVIELLELAKKYRKQVFFYNEDHLKELRIVNELGYYKLPLSLIVDKHNFDNNVDDILCIVSDSGNKVFKLMNRIAVNEDPLLKLRSDDTVVIASPIVPGTEKDAANMENDLYKADVKVHKLSSKDVLSMHASKEDLKMMIYLVKPKYYIPIKGDYSDLLENADIAVEMGYTPDKIIILDNGQFATFDKEKLISTKDTFKVEDSLIDGSDSSEVASIVLQDRETLSTDGVIIVGVVIDFKTKKLIGGPDVQSRGVIYLKDAEDILKKIGNLLIECIETNVKNKTYNNLQTRGEARDKISQYVFKETGKKPMILPAIVEMNSESENGKENN